MREIKFRAWDKTREEMINVDILLNTPNGMQQYRINRPEINGVLDVEFIKEDIILMQYTGLKDKNDVEIYEGDICRCWGGAEFNGYYEYNKIYEVEWQGSGFEMMIDNCGYGWNYTSGFEYIEIIGNIYENQELLN